LKLFRFRYINILREIIENNFTFPPEFGRPFFVLGASQDAWMPFWLKAWGWEEDFSEWIDIQKTQNNTHAHNIQYFMA
jgi:hypothetical protein